MLSLEHQVSMLATSSAILDIVVAFFFPSSLIMDNRLIRNVRCVPSIEMLEQPTASYLSTLVVTGNFFWGQ